MRWRGNDGGASSGPPETGVTAAGHGDAAGPPMGSPGAASSAGSGSGSGVFIAFEGGEASGKSTQARRLSEAVGAVLTREPGGTDLGRRFRSIVLDPRSERLDPRAEALLMLADRAQHVAEVVRPSLEAGRTVITDRFSGSTLAYQGWARGLDVEELRSLSAWASAGLEPDLVVLLDVAPDVALQRMARSRPDRLESAGPEFHRLVADGYRALATADPDHWRVVDGSGAPEEVAERVVQVYRSWVASVVGG